MLGFYKCGRLVVARDWISVVALVLVTACANDAPLAPSSTDAGTGVLAAQVAANDSLIRSTTATTRSAAGAAAGTAVSTGALLSRLPASLALTSAQRAQLDTLVAKHEQAIASDVAAYNAILVQARSARESGATSASIDAIIATGADVRKRLDAASAAHFAAIEAILSPAQREWLATCANGPVMSSAQAEQIATLLQAFESATAADMAAIEQALATITALRNGAQPDSAIEAQIRSVLEQVTPARERLRAAQQKLEADIAKIVGNNTCEG